MSDVFAGMPCTDEDAAREGVGDYATLAPKCEILTEGADGAFAPTSWDLTSASNDFAAQGIQAGHVVVLASRAGVDANNKPKTFPMGNALMGVASTLGTACTLHRLGYDTGMGRPPGAPSGLSSINFQVPSVLIHIKSAAVELRRMLGILATVDLSTLPDVRRLAALLALRSLYFAQYRQPDADTWKSKMKDLDAEIDRELLSLRGTFPLEDVSGSRPEVGYLIFDTCGPCRPWGCTDEL